MTFLWMILAVAVLVAVAALVVVSRRNRSGSTPAAEASGWGTATTRMGLEPHSKRDNGMDGGSL